MTRERTVPDGHDIAFTDADSAAAGKSGAGASASAGQSGTDRRGGPTEGVELFQNAMLELIAAARTALDTAEELVADPHAIGTAIEALRGLAVEALRGGVSQARSAVVPDDDVDDFQSIRVDDDGSDDD